MDSLTHLVLGAVVGEVTARKQLGKKALVAGAVAQYIPDLDVIAALWLGPAENLIFHRGITHSFLFVIAGSVGLAGLARWLTRSSVSWRFWITFFALQSGIHIFIDAFNAYGAGWLEPFSSRKISFHTLYVADPVFLLPLLFGLITILVARSERSRRVGAFVGLAVSILYLMFTIGARWIVIEHVKHDMRTAGISANDFLLTPTPLNSLLWFVAARDDKGFHIAHVSIFDNDSAGQYTFFPQQDQLLEGVEDESALETLRFFSQGYYTAEMWGDTVVFNNLLFGQMKGWENPNGRFVFHYIMDYPEANTLVMQRGRFAGWNKDTVKRLLRRMSGIPVSRADENKK